MVLTVEEQLERELDHLNRLRQFKQNQIVACDARIAVQIDKIMELKKKVGNKNEQT